MQFLHPEKFWPNNEELRHLFQKVRFLKVNSDMPCLNYQMYCDNCLMTRKSCGYYCSNHNEMLGGGHIGHLFSRGIQIFTFLSFSFFSPFFFLS